MTDTCKTCDGSGYEQAAGAYWPCQDCDKGKAITAKQKPDCKPDKCSCDIEFRYQEGLKAAGSWWELVRCDWCKKRDELWPEMIEQLEFHAGGMEDIEDLLARCKEAAGE